jgi:predicted MPP superfamily phosphohydrolase
LKKDILLLYFPALIPRHRQAKKWRCLVGYGSAELIGKEGSIKIVKCRVKAHERSASGKKILFFSDLHYSSGTDSLAESLFVIARNMKPDLLLCGGDFCSDAVSVASSGTLLEKLAGCAPCCAAIPGNWERGKCWLPLSFWEDFFTRHNWHFLCNTALEAENWGWIYGCDDISRGYPALLTTPPAGREKILLAHRPDTVIAVDHETPLDGFRLALCGHTHGGQIRLPFIGALTAPSFYGRRLVCGLYGKENSDVRMIVSTGVNHASFPWRINCRREVLLIEFN